MRRVLPFPLVVLLFLAGVATAHASPPHKPIPPEVNGAVDLMPRPCAYEGGDSSSATSTRSRAGRARTTSAIRAPASACASPSARSRSSRARTTSWSEPVRIEKPMRDGYITRFKPNLVAPTGPSRRSSRSTCITAPGSRAADYGSGPFFAAGEEKTIAPFPRGYGMPVKATDQWLLLYMVHSAVQQPMEALHHLRHRLRPAGEAAEARAQARLSASGSTCGPPATRSSTSSATTAARRQVHLAEGGVRRLRPVGQEDRRPGRAGQRHRRGLAPAGRGRVARRDRQLHRRHADRDRRPPASGGHPERDRPRARRPSRNGSTPAVPPTGTATNTRNPAARRPRGTSRCG